MKYANPAKSMIIIQNNVQDTILNATSVSNNTQMIIPISPSIFFRFILHS